MERRRNYFMPNNGQIGFSPLHMLGLSAIHPKSMQHGFVDVSVNTHTVDNNFSLFKCKDQDTNFVNMKNDFMNTFGCDLPVRNSFSKLIGGFIGSKCLIGSSTGRENYFWGKVLQQYNSIMGTDNNMYVTMSAMSSKGNTGEYIKAGAVDAALLFSQSFDLLNTNNLISEKESMGATKRGSSQESSASVGMRLQEQVPTEPKQSYAEVAKSQVANKSVSNRLADRSSVDSKSLRSVRRNPVKLRQKKHSFDTTPNNWRYGGNLDDYGKYMDSTDYSRESRRKHSTASRDNQHKSVTTTNSTKGTGTLNTLEDQKISHVRTRHVQHSASNRKLPGKKRLNSNLLSDMREDCLGVDDLSYERKGSFNQKFKDSPNKKWTPPTDQISPSNRCANWRCRPYSLCDPCKMKRFSGKDVPDCYVTDTQHETVTSEIEQKDKENNVPGTPVSSLTGGTPDVTSAKPIACSDSSVTEYEIFVSTRCPVLRARISSECSVDSEDSFVIMFDASGDESYEETSSGTSSLCSDSDDDDDEDNDDDTSSINSQCLTHEESSDLDVDYDHEYDYDEVDFNEDAEIEGLISARQTELKEANERWESAYEDTPSAEKEPAKVQFAGASELTTVHKIIAWDFAYRAARLGPWELMARDRIRFQRHIDRMNRILSPVLQDQHRRNIWQKFHKGTLDVP